AHEEPTARAFMDTVTAQDREPRVPIVELVDRKYAEGRLDGFQYADMPDDRDAWHLVLRGLDETATGRYGRRFHELEEEAREAICEDMSRGVLEGGAWSELNVIRAWSVCLRGVLSEFYSHPWAWNEIGFGGPAYPRGYARIGEIGIREPFEKADSINVDPVRDVERKHLP
ncbi:MAG: gluconate 2-dehydrogenase subunit 3 family protein, partial [Candidatus Dormibacteraceae bacterium]